MKFKFTHESRRNFYFQPLPEQDLEDVSVSVQNLGLSLNEDGYVKIEKSRFKNREEALEWLLNKAQDDPDNGASRKTKVLFHEGNIIKQAGDPTDGEWETIKGFMVNPDKFQKEDVAAYEVKLANNIVDRDGERFHEDVLKSFRDTLVGKAFLIGHRWGPPGRGRFFSANIEKDGDVQWLTGKFYLLKKHNEELIDHVDAGIWNWVSIGFRVPKRVPVYEDDDSEKIKYWEYQNTDKEKAEAFEGSLVWLGAQYGAEIRKMFGEEATDVVGFIHTENGVQPIFGKDIQTKREWTTAYINSLEDNCFAVVEKTGRKDDQGRTLPKTARHLPHHPKGGGAAGTGGTVDLPHLRNALARMNQIKPVTDTISTEELRRRAKRHLIAHAKKLGIGDYDILEMTDHDEQTKQILEEFDVEKILKIEKLALELPVDSDEDIQKAAETIEEKLSELDEQKQFVEALKAEFGDEVNLDELKQLKAQAGDAKKYREFLIDEIIKYGVLTGYIEKSAVEDEKKFYNDLEITRLEKEREKLMKKYDKEHPNSGVLKDNEDPKDPTDGVEVKGNPENYRIPV